MRFVVGASMHRGDRSQQPEQGVALLLTFLMMLVLSGLALAAGVFYPFTLSPEIAALAMSGSSALVAINALLLKRTRLGPRAHVRQGHPHQDGAAHGQASA